MPEVEFGRPGRLCKPLCCWGDRLKAVMSLKLFIFHIQCSAHQERGILAWNCGTYGSARPSICRPDRRGVCSLHLVSCRPAFSLHASVRACTHTHSLCPTLHIHRNSDRIAVSDRNNVFKTTRCLFQSHSRNPRDPKLI